MSAEIASHPERRAITVTLDPREIWAEVAPYKARGLLLSVNAVPLWLPRLKVWTVSHQHGRDVIALAEHLGFSVTVLEETPRSDRELGVADISIDDVDHPDIVELDQAVLFQ